MLKSAGGGWSPSWLLARTRCLSLISEIDCCSTNPAACKVLGLGLETDEGEPIDTVIKQSELIELLRSNSPEMQSTEINLSGGRIFLATATSVLAEGQRVGRVCVLRDITHFKELDSLKIRIRLHREPRPTLTTHTDAGLCDHARNGRTAQ